MRSSEFEKLAVENLVDKHGLTEEELAEALPAIAAVGKALGGAVAKAGGALAKAGAQGLKKVGSAAAQKTKQAATDIAKSAAQKVTQKVTQKAQQQMSNQLLKKGSSIPFPTQSGQAKDFEIDDVKGDEVTIVNPDAKNKPEEPEKLVYKKQDIEAVIQGLQQ